jgi:aldehyde dehydrogenase (NAD+)
MTDINSLLKLRHYYETGITRPYAFRVEQLKKFKAVVLKYEKEIEAALYADLKKSPEEAYATETGLLLAELNTAIKNLRQWMRPERRGTNLVNLPSSSYIVKDPLGVVLIIGAWNYPLQLLLIPLVGAIAGGNCAVIKPSELAPATAGIVEKMMTEIFAGEYILTVQGNGAEVVPAMMSARTPSGNLFRFDHVFYTGSIPVGKSIYQLAAKDLIPVTLELGGKSPAIVEADASLKATARRIVMGKFINSGQTCVAPDYVLVHASVKDKLIGQIKDSIEHFYTSDPSTSYSYSKIINERRFDKLLTYLQQGTIIYGGNHDRSKLYIQPTLIDNVSLDAPLMTEEIFGPVLPVFTFNTMEEAIRIVQRNADPLAFYLFTSSSSKEKEWVEKVSFGGACINNAAWHFANHHIPFGGIRNSGIGSYHGKSTFEVFTHRKPVMKTPTWFDPDIKYPPFEKKLKLFRWVIR